MVVGVTRCPAERNSWLQSIGRILPLHRQPGRFASRVLAAFAACAIIAVFDPAPAAAQAAATDTTPPTWGYSRHSPSDEAIGAGTTSVTFRVTFNEDLGHDLATGDFAANGDVTATVSALAEVTSRRVYDVTLDTFSGTGSLGLAIPGGISDTSDNATGNNPQPENFQFYDRQLTAPVVEEIRRHSPNNDYTNADSLTWRIQFNETVANVDASDFEITGTTATITGLANTDPTSSPPGDGVDSPSSGISGSNIYLTISGGDLAGLSGQVSFAFADGQDITDTLGNPLADTTPTGGDNRTFNMDNTAPSLVSIERQTPSFIYTNADQLVFRLTFTESPRGPQGGQSPLDISGTTATMQGVANVEGDDETDNDPTNQAVFDVTIGGGDLASVDATVSLALTQFAWTDAAGNAFTSLEPTGANESYIVDNTAPTLTASGPAGPVNGPFSVTVTISEPTDSSLVATNLFQITNGTHDGNWVWGNAEQTEIVFTITPIADGLVTLEFGSGAVTDFAGNTSAATTGLFSVQNDRSRTLTVALAGVGSGSVASTPAGIDCGDDCSETYQFGTEITLSATPAAGSSFAGWTAGPCAGSGVTPCTFNLNSDIDVAARFTLDEPPQGRVFTATLPAARSGYVGGPVITAFLSIVSEQTVPAQSCTISAPDTAPFDLSYRQVDANNVPIGANDPVFDIQAGGSVSFVLILSPTAQTGNDGFVFLPDVSCQASLFDPIVGVSSLLLTIGAAPAPDLLSIGATQSNDGVLRIQSPGAASAMTAAVVNIGAGDGTASSASEITLNTSIDTGDVAIPVTVEICEIDLNAVCQTPRASSVVTQNLAQNAPAFFAAFVRDNSGGSGIVLDAANNRVFLRFADGNGVVRSVTSVAVTAPSADGQTLSSSIPEGRWSVLTRPSGDALLARSSVHVNAAGIGIVDDGDQLRLIRISPDDEDTGSLGSRAHFRVNELNGFYTLNGAIRVGRALAPEPGHFWGVRDSRGTGVFDWSAYSGAFGSVHITDASEIRGVLDGCSVYGAPSLDHVVELTLSACPIAGNYYATIDRPANDNDLEAASLLIVNDFQSWRLSR